MVLAATSNRFASSVSTISFAMRISSFVVKGMSSFGKLLLSEELVCADTVSGETSEFADSVERNPNEEAAEDASEEADMERNLNNSL